MSGIYTSKRDRKKRYPVTQRYSSTSAPVKGEVVFPNKQITTSYRSRGNPMEFNLQANAITTSRTVQPRTDHGHEFFTRQEIVNLTHRDFKLSRTGAEFRGPLVVGSTIYSEQPGFRKEPVFNMGYYGPQAISKTTPTNSKVNIVQTLAEIVSEGLPRFFTLTQQIQALGKPVRFAGGKYLELAFGWAPLMGELRSLIELALTASTAITQFERDSSKSNKLTHVRRNLRFPIRNSTEVLPLNGGAIGPEYIGGLFNQLIGTPRAFVREQTTRETVWFSGAYTYYIPVNKGLAGKLAHFEALANHLLGTRITAETLWELTPWSWLLDWFVNIGEGVNASVKLGSDGLLLHYGYLMRTTVLTDTATAFDVPVKSGGTLRSVGTTYSSVTKERFRANPYGFGLTDADLSPQRLAILVALGMSEWPGRR